MKPTCEEVRERAFRDGLDGASMDEWRAHCRTCPDCRTELFILENLERQASEERQHLGRDEVQKLLETARNQKRRRRPNHVLIWSLRAACFLALLTVGAGFFPGESAARLRSRIESWLRNQEGTSSATMADASHTPADNSADTAAEPTGPIPPAVMVPAAQVSRDLLELRRSLDQRRQSLRRLLERDFGPFNPEDAWYVAFRPDPDRA